MSLKKLRVLDLFSGIGGFSLGLERTGGFETVAFCEIEEYSDNVLEQHWPDVVSYEDVRTLTRERLANDGIGQIDVICGGFPCQDISTAGKGAGLHGERSGLWFEYLRLIDEVGPSYVIIENVSALRGRGLSTILQNLCEIGYDAEWHCITASSVGAPHRRDRIWIIAYPTSAELQGDHKRVLCEQDRGGREVWREGIRQTHRETSSDLIGPAIESISRPENVARTMCEGLQGQRKITRGYSQILKDVGNSGWWLSESKVDRVVDGLPGRVDRVKALGNAVVPQIPELIGEAILEWVKC